MRWKSIRTARRLPRSLRRRARRFADRPAVGRMAVPPSTAAFQLFLPAEGAAVYPTVHPYPGAGTHVVNRVENGAPCQAVRIACGTFREQAPGCCAARSGRRAPHRCLDLVLVHDQAPLQQRALYPASISAVSCIALPVRGLRTLLPGAFQPALMIISPDRNCILFRSGVSPVALEPAIQVLREPAALLRSPPPLWRSCFSNISISQ